MSKQTEHKQFGRYTVVRPLGKGAMGIVYLGEDPVISRQVAIKVIRAHPDLDGTELEERQARFEREFRSAGNLSHPNIVTVYDVGKEGNDSYITMEYVQGESLESVLKSERSFTFKEISEIATQLAIAPLAQLVDGELPHIPDHRERSRGVAVEGGVSDRGFALVARREDQPSVLVGQRHEHHPPYA